MTLRRLTFVLVLAVAPISASAQSLFSDAFGGSPCAGAPAGWSGKDGAPTPFSAYRTSDPTKSSNCVVAFLNRTAGGDAYSSAITAPSGAKLVLEFDYLGYQLNGMGGTIGISEGFPAGHRWFAGTDPGDGSIEQRVTLVADGVWHHYVTPFDPFEAGGCCGYTGSGVFRVMIEQFNWWSQYPAGSAYFDNIRVGLNAIAVTVDVKPGTTGPAPINIGSAGVIPVAILSDRTFDATQVNPATVRVAGAVVRLTGNAQGCSTDDVDGDGRLDLLCQVATNQLDLLPGVSYAEVEAETWAGVRVFGWDSIQLVP